MNNTNFTYKRITASGLIKSTPGLVSGFIVNSHSSGTLALIDGPEGSAVAASSVLTSSGASVPASFYIFQKIAKK